MFFLDLLRILLSTQVIAGIIVTVFLVFYRSQIGEMIKRVAKFRTPGFEVCMSQSERSEDAATAKPEPSIPPEEQVILPDNLSLSPDEREKLQQRFSAERAKAYLWEYRYLNLFLVPRTQMVLDWLAPLGKGTTYSLYSATWMPVIPDPNERDIIIKVLEMHYLVLRQGDLLEVSSKGREYIEWRGPLPRNSGS